MKLHIMTWNCDLYKENPCSLNWDRYNSIMNIIKGRLELENSIVVLQEIPYMSRETWKEHPFYLRFVEDFPEDKYKSVFSISNKNQIMMTVILYKKSNNNFEDYNDSSANNRIAYCKFKDIILVGVHMPTSFEKNDKDDEKTKSDKIWREKIWNNLIAFVKAKKTTDKTIILGDFNAFIGCDYKSTEEKFIDLHRYVDDIIPDDIPTYTHKERGIDHIFVNFNTQLRYKFCIGENYELSDHKYITAEFDL